MAFLELLPYQVLYLEDLYQVKDLEFAVHCSSTLSSGIVISTSFVLLVSFVRLT